MLGSLVKYELTAYVHTHNYWFFGSKEMLGRKINISSRVMLISLYISLHNVFDFFGILIINIFVFNINCINSIYMVSFSPCWQHSMIDGIYPGNDFLHEMYRELVTERCRRKEFFGGFRICV